MIGLVLIVLGLLALLGGWLLLRHTGTGWRVGRLLAAAPRRSLEEATVLATSGAPTYVKVHGRVDSDEEFPADDDTPLVFQRRRLQRAERGWVGGTRWRTFDDQRLAVPFRLVERGERLDVDLEALGDGLVVVPRLSTGVAADLALASTAQPPPVMAADHPVRLRIDQLLAVDHVTAAGVPRRDASGDTVLGPGLGRPLVLTNLDLDEAMRVLGSEHRLALLLASGLIAVAPMAIVLGLLGLGLGW